MDWALSLSSISAKCYLVHRRPRFRAAPATTKLLGELIATGRIEVLAPAHLDALHGTNGVLSGVTVRIGSEERLLEADVLLPFYGMRTDLGPLSNGGWTCRKERSWSSPERRRQTVKVSLRSAISPLLRQARSDTDRICGSRAGSCRSCDRAARGRADVVALNKSRGSCYGSCLRLASTFFRSEGTSILTVVTRAWRHFAGVARG